MRYNKLLVHSLKFKSWIKFVWTIYIVSYIHNNVWALPSLYQTPKGLTVKLPWPYKPAHEGALHPFGPCTTCSLCDMWFVWSVQSSGVLSVTAQNSPGRDSPSGFDPKSHTAAAANASPPPPLANVIAVMALLRRRKPRRWPAMDRRRCRGVGNDPPLPVASKSLAIERLCLGPWRSRCWWVQLTIGLPYTYAGKRSMTPPSTAWHLPAHPVVLKPTSTVVHQRSASTAPSASFMLLLDVVEEDLYGDALMDLRAWAMMDPHPVLCFLREKATSGVLFSEEEEQFLIECLVDLSMKIFLPMKNTARSWGHSPTRTPQCRDSWWHSIRCLASTWDSSAMKKKGVEKNENPFPSLSLSDCSNVHACFLQRLSHNN
jgi:hypothetical protein